MKSLYKHTCILCGDTFETNRSKGIYCAKDHYAACLKCGKTFLQKKVVKPPKYCSSTCAAQDRQNTATKKCKACGDEFTATNNNSRYCGKTHQKPCKTCGKDFIPTNLSKQQDYCSRTCALGSPDKQKTCDLCGEDFIPLSAAQKYCPKTHTTPCETCGKALAFKRPSRKPRYCSPPCASQRSQGHKVTCELCGEEFIAATKRARYCSKNHQKPCAQCSKLFKINPLQQAKTCSPRCAALSIDYEKRNSKTAETLSEKYGLPLTNASQAPEVKAAKKAKAQERYGVDNVSQAPEVQEKRKQTNLDRYGVPNGGGAPEVQARIRKTVKERYGVDNVFQAKEVKEKIRKTLQETYGEEVNYPLQAEAIKAKARATTKEHFGVESILSLPEVQLLSSASQRLKISQVNRKWKKNLEEALHKDFTLEQPFAPGKYADLARGDLFIDFNPLVTHNSTIAFVHLTKRCTTAACTKHQPLSLTHHQDRFLEAEAAGKTLLQWFPWHDQDLFASVVQAKVHADTYSLGARKTLLRRIDQSTANKFFKENHLLGPAKGQTYCVGLYAPPGSSPSGNEELVHVQSYGPARFTKAFAWEAIRSCSKQGWHIQGAVTRCDRAFMKAEDPQSIISYVDLALGGGTTEAQNPGWRLMATNKPALHWCLPGRTSPEDSRPLFLREASVRKLSADRLLGMAIGSKYPTHHEDGSPYTNEEVLLQEGYLKMADAGSRTFAWKKTW